ncbi:hypothetical protein I4U23_014325 [Adineta vaga]|nr:hypothetical protein I4U23_014325 [Adineta vaga]
MTTIKFDTVRLQFEKFLYSIGNILTSENETNIIQNKLRRHFNTTTSDYLCSDEFITSLNHIQNLFVENNESTKFFTLLASFDEQLKKHSIKLQRTTVQTSDVASSITLSLKSELANERIEKTTLPLPETTESTIEFEFSITAVQELLENLLDQCCNISSQSTVIPKETSITTDVQHERKIRKLERRLNRLSRMIRDLEEKDMSLEEMGHCDLYLVESNLKKQACEMYAKLSDLKKQTPSTERIIHQPIALNNSESDHPLITKDLEAMVNQSKHFPSFSDVLETVEKANEKYQLHLNEEYRRKLAEKSFKIIGKQIKDRRMADFNDIMNSRLPEGFNIEQNDPAIDNAEITQVLLENEREAIIKTEKIFEEFSQITPDPDIEINLENTDVESGNESDEHLELDIVEERTGNQDDAMEINQASETTTSVVPTSEISFVDRTLTILTTASLPTKPTTYDGRESDISTECEPQTLTPRRKQTLTDNEIIYKLYRERLTNNASPVSADVVSKRPLSRADDNLNVKKTKRQIPELIVLD